MTAEPTTQKTDTSTEVTAQAAPQEAKTSKKKSKKKYTADLRVFQEFEVAMTAGTHRLVEAVDKGIRVWEKERDKSGRKKKNGAMRNSFRNLNKSMRRFNEIAVDAPSVFTDHILDMKMIKAIYK